MSTQPTATEGRPWADELNAVGERLGRYCAHAEPRRRAVASLHGLLSDAEHKNGWQLVAKAPDATPYGVQHLRGRADWDADRVRDDLIVSASAHLAGPQGVLIVDETGFLKKGTKSAGVQRQDSGTAGPIENCQIGVFLALAGGRGHALVDRAVDLPKEWAGDAARRKATGVPPEVAFATKPQRAERMRTRAWRAGVQAAWVPGEAVSGNDPHFRRTWELNRQPDVRAVKSDQRRWVDLRQVRVDRIAEGWPVRAWRTASAGAGSPGPRWYDGAVAAFGPVDHRGWRLWLLVRRPRDRHEERAYSLGRGPASPPRRELIRVAGSRWPVEECFARVPGDCGLDEDAARSWVGWYRTGPSRCRCSLWRS